MKKYYILSVLLFAAGVLSSCKEDDVTEQVELSRSEAFGPQSIEISTVGSPLQLNVPVPANAQQIVIYRNGTLFHQYVQGPQAIASDRAILRTGDGIFQVNGSYTYVFHDKVLLSDARQDGNLTYKFEFLVGDQSVGKEEISIAKGVVRPTPLERLWSAASPRVIKKGEVNAESSLHYKENLSKEEARFTASSPIVTIEIVNHQWEQTIGTDKVLALRKFDSLGQVYEQKMLAANKEIVVNKGALGGATPKTHKLLLMTKLGEGNYALVQMSALRPAQVNTNTDQDRYTGIAEFNVHVTKATVKKLP